MADKPTFFDIASGCGGLARGFADAGFECAGAVDVDPVAVALYRLNVSPKACLQPVEEVHLRRGSVDCLVGGLPCEGFSTLGKMEDDYAGNKLWWHFARLLDEARPSAFVVENVPPFARSRRFSLLKAKAERLGYTVSHAVLDATRFGVSQRRQRVFVVGTKTPVELPQGEGRKPTVRDAIGDLPGEPDGKNDHDGRNARPHSRERYRHVPPGGDRFDLPDELQNPCWRAEPRGAHGVFGRLRWDEPADTIRTTFLKPECGRYIHPEQHRGLTVREGARLQGFPDAFRFQDPETGLRPGVEAKARVIGRAVPPPVAEAVARALRAAL